LQAVLDGLRPAPAAELPLDQPLDVGRLAQAQQAIGVLTALSKAHVSTEGGAAAA